MSMDVGQMTMTTSLTVRDAVSVSFMLCETPRERATLAARTRLGAWPDCRQSSRVDR